MKSAILSVGTEILMGQIVNTNATYLSKELNDIGIDVMYHHTVGDNPKRLTENFDVATEAERIELRVVGSTLVITSPGGLRGIIEDRKSVV